MHKRLLILCSCLLCYLAPAVGQNFREVSRQAGLVHLYNMGDVIYGGGVAVIDYNNDGWEDLYVTGGMHPDALFKNNGDKSFTNVFDGSGLEVTLEFLTQGVITGDIDNDGFSDLFVTARSPANALDQYAHDLLFKNNGDGTFTDITAEWGLDEVKRFSTAAAFGDVNLDGKLDLYVGTYLSEPVMEVFDEDGNIGPEFTGEKDMFYINTGQAFEKQTSVLGIDIPGLVLGCAFTDYDNDRDLDLYVANDFGNWDLPSNILYDNQLQEEDQFVDVAPMAGADIAMNAMGVAHGDYNNDGFLDYFITNMGQDFLLRNNGDGTFKDATVEANLVSVAVPHGDAHFFAVSWGTMFFDFDHDGFLDLFWANGDLSPPALPNSNKLYRNLGDGTFEDVTFDHHMQDHHVGRGAAILDYDLDGDMDLVVVNQEYPEGLFEEEDPNLLLYENLTNDSKNYLKIKLKGLESNSQGYGAHIIVHCGDTTWMREIEGGSSHMSHNSTVAHFGLGEHQMADEIEIYWLGGKRQVLENVAVNQMILVTESDNHQPKDVVTSLQVDSREKDVIIYPNPSRGIFYLDDYKPVTSKLSLIDPVGKVVHQFKIQGKTLKKHRKFKIPGNIPNGVYIVTDGIGYWEQLILKRQ